MTSKPLDIAIVGHSLAAAAAALSLESSGLRGVWCSDVADSGGLDSLVAVRTQDGQLFDTGEQLEREVLRRTETSFEISGTVDHVEWCDDHFKIRCCGGPLHEVRVILAAPFGTDRGLPPHIDGRHYYGVGVSQDASADGPYVVGKDVSVLGQGLRAAEQALIASSFARQVTILSSKPPRFGVLAARIHGQQNIVVRECLQLTGLEGEPNKALSAIVVQNLRTRARQRIPSEMLFLAQDLHFPAYAYGGPNGFSDLLAKGSMFTAGLAAGVNYEDRGAMLSSGQAQAEKIRKFLNLA